jgi:hypothetical protein
MDRQITRGPWLVGFLILSGVIAAIGLISYIAVWQEMSNRYTPWAAPVGCTLVVIHLFSIIAVWFWSRLGVVAFVAVEVATIPYSVALGWRHGEYAALVWAALLVFLTWRQWDHMSWGLSWLPKQAAA